MPASPTDIDAALQQLLGATQTHASDFIRALPLRDTDIAELHRALLGKPGLRDELVRLQEQYMRDWLAIAQGRANRDNDQSADRRFAAPEWTELAWFRTLREVYDLNAWYVRAVTALADVPPAVRRRLQFSSTQLIDAMSPVNNPLTNPQVIARALHSRGESLAKGSQAFASDLERRRISMTDESEFEVGRNLAITPGEVVYENELIQLIQYRPTTRRVRARPLLIVPPFINKYYILDLRPENSFVGYCVDQGICTFIISWRNIPLELGHLCWDDYITQGVFEAIDAVRDISRNETINVLGYCVGGTLLASALAIKAARNEQPAASITLLASMLDFSDTGDISAYVDETYVAHCEQRFADNGIVPGSQLANAFASLRPNELVWYFVVNNYLLGNAPRAFDLLYWNSDSANLPGPLFSYYLRNMYLENRLRTAGALHMDGTPVDLGKIALPSLVVATREDHIVPWETAYLGARLLRADTEFVLGASGHVAGIVNPPEANQRQFWVNENVDLVQQPDQWLEAARATDGSWWPHWMKWLRRYSGKSVAARKTMGNAKYRPVEPAPGRYVRERGDLPVSSRETDQLSLF
ncbi:MAG: class I poly(R)-hydroxyalkanoic acid synthase [Burkholderiales bacterium]|jgi:polyhydroxyalkanoate synthase